MLMPETLTINGRKCSLVNASPAGTQAAAQIGQTAWGTYRGPRGAAWLARRFKDGSFDAMRPNSRGFYPAAV